FLEMIGKGDVPRYALYHASFGEFLTSDRNTDTIDGRKANEAIAECILGAVRGDWGNCRDLYSLEHAVIHIVRSLDRDNPGETWAKLERLTHEAFLDAKASRLGDAKAASDAREMALTLAQAGEEHWEVFVSTASRYCEFVERLRREVRAVEGL